MDLRAELAKGVTTLFLLYLLYLAVFALLVQLIWNTLISGLLNTRKITYLESFLAIILVYLIMELVK